MGVGEASVVALTALRQQCLGLLEEDRVEQRLFGLMDDVAEGDLAEVAPVTKDAEDDLGAPSPPGAGAMPVVVQFGGDGGCAGSFGSVAGEYPFDDGNSEGLMARWWSSSRRSP